MLEDWSYLIVFCVVALSLFYLAWGVIAVLVSFMERDTAPDYRMLARTRERIDQQRKLIPIPKKAGQ